MNLVQRLFQYGFVPEDIAIITPYQGQYDVYRTALRAFQRAEPQRNLSPLRVRKIDGFQGGEATIVLFDIVVTHRLGFARESNRINVAITRPRDGLVFICDVESIRKNNKRYTRYLRPIIDDFKRHKQVRTISETDKITNQFVTTSLYLALAASDPILKPTKTDISRDSGSADNTGSPSSITLRVKTPTTDATNDATIDATDAPVDVDEPQPGNESAVGWNDTNWGRQSPEVWASEPGA